MISDPTFTSMGACGWGSDMGLIAHVGPAGCRSWHMCRNWMHGCVC
jgi:hypothetical protein